MKTSMLSILVGLLTIVGSVTFSHAQTDTAQEESTAMTDTAAQAQADTTADTTQAAEQSPDQKKLTQEKKKKKEEPQSFHQIIKEKFIEGGWQFMGIVLLCLIFGLAFAIERIIVLNIKTVNTNQLLEEINEAMKSGGVDAAKEVCRSTRGPIASVLFQGLDRADEGIDVVEKSIVSSGSVEMGKMEKGLVWISLFIAIAPMLGFMGTVIGMIDAFDNIESAGSISPSLVAGGIKTALLTTLGGLIVAVILQVFYNYIVSKIDGLVNSMEDSSITLVDLLIKHDLVKK